jgi:hypothetical protein
MNHRAFGRAASAIALNSFPISIEVTEGETATYAFYHHLLQEYFAAREVLRQFRAGQNLSKRWRVSWRTWHFMPKRLAQGEAVPPPPVTGWEETFVMAAGLAGKDAVRFITAIRRDNLPLAGRCLAEAGPDRPDLGTLVESTRTALLARQRHPSAHLRARIAAGLALGEVGHPDLLPRKFEFEGRAVWSIVPALQPVPAGEFIRGSDRTDKRAYADEYITERRVTLPAYSIGRYPVINAEYRFFIEDGGYQDDRWWSETGRTWKQGGPDAYADATQDWLDYRKFIQTSDEKLEARAKHFASGMKQHSFQMKEPENAPARFLIARLIARPIGTTPTSAGSANRSSV